MRVPNFTRITLWKDRVLHDLFKMLEDFLNSFMATIPDLSQVKGKIEKLEHSFAKNNAVVTSYIKQELGKQKDYYDQELLHIMSDIDLLYGCSKEQKVEVVKKKPVVKKKKRA